MLVMLDAIDEKFRCVGDLWERLKNNVITFYFLPIRDMGLTDELYIKMNSRGKPLTLFEHFKAELEKEMTAVDKSAAQRIIAKFDREWMDLLWRYRDSGKGTDEDDTTDDEFLNYFAYICDVICYRMGESPQFRSSDEFKLISMYFSQNCDSVLANMEFLEKSFDCWCNISCADSPAEFLQSFMSAEHEKGKIRIDSRYRDRIDIFEDCLHRYTEVSGRQRRFPLNRFVMLFAINCYLQNLDSISNEDFRRRIRIVNNLIQNSEDEVADRQDRNRIPAILDETEAIMLTGKIDNTIENHFNVAQTKEEEDKMVFLRDNPDKAEQLYALEDNEMLHGQVGIIGLNNISLGERFASLFKCSWDKIDCALMAIGDYGQRERNGWRYQYASAKKFSAWDELFHRSSNSGFENTGSILANLLQTNDTFDDEKLEKISSEYLIKCEQEGLYPWRYYYIKYPEFRPGSYGKMASMGQSVDEKYMFAVMQTKSYLSEYTYMPCLMAADPDFVDTADKGRSLQYDDQYIYCENGAFVVRGNDNDDDDEDLARIEILQNEDCIDTEDRIIKLREYLDGNIQYYE